MEMIDFSVLAEWRQHTSVNADKMSYLRNHINGVSTTNRIYYQLRRIEELTNNAQSVAGKNLKKHILNCRIIHASGLLPVGRDQIRI